MGLRYVKGLSRATAERIVAAGEARGFASIDDLARRAALDQGALARLAEAGALRGFEGNRRAAYWVAKGVVRDAPGAMQLDRDEMAPFFEGLDPFETIGWDYRASGHSTAGHPLEPLRERMRALKLPDAHEIRAMPDGRRVRYAGLVICRQRPGTASGVVFLTLEDESGFVNVVVWSRVYEEFRLLVKTASFLGITGKLQVQDGVVHVIAERFWEPRALVAPARAASRDFH